MAVLKYTLLRLATFFIIFGACLLLEVGMVFALVAGLVGAWAVAYLFFNRLRLEAGAQVARKVGSDTRRRSRSEQSDNDAEDALAEDYHEDR
ncbi:DUF4229 domain-containing protein [Nesterenkonia lacusekhoensis]|uniref:DUF4229 domain-containing protein n=1 Tax=Nesterenkonia lacusekhoensis TaxID=150832 RepID=A0ABS4SXX1_9MICC|nr:DUF4229 domain-containing protein [Nesterenkonia lacusekhoensis]MBP2317055.1 hypothetical protein [Nesterenkonia lacusekhoensis]